MLYIEAISCFLGSVHSTRRLISGYSLAKDPEHLYTSLARNNSAEIETFHCHCVFAIVTHSRAIHLSL